MICTQKINQQCPPAVRRGVKSVALDGEGGEPLQHLPVVRGGRDKGRGGREAEERVNSVLQQWRGGTYGGAGGGARLRTSRPVLHQVMQSLRSRR